MHALIELFLVYVAQSGRDCAPFKERLTLLTIYGDDTPRLEFIRLFFFFFHIHTGNILATA